MSPRLVGLRGATTFEVDEAAHVTERIVELVTEMLDANTIHHDDLVSIIFTATADLNCIFPAAAARTIGLGDVPLMCAQELSIDGSMPKCVRVLMHLERTDGRSGLRHIYLHNAASLRDDLPS